MAALAHGMSLVKAALMRSRVAFISTTGSMVDAIAFCISANSSFIPEFIISSLASETNFLNALI